MNVSESSIHRYPRWVAVSHSLTRYETYMVPTVQGLGRLDEQLTKFDSIYCAGGGYIREGFDIFDFSEHLTLSYLWVLGAYEVVRVIAERERSNQSLFATGISGVLRQFERVRIPLAKFEPAKKHRTTDSHIAYPVLNSDYGIAWQVAQDTFIARSELSDAFLHLLEAPSA